ncbi:hypothetical protein [Microbacterium gubbeenense]|uniref:hypothetical protein n=1 Tax=Microbacterium gubbeenense TaxID=159896 RepID=UPI003F9D270D
MIGRIVLGGGIAAAAAAGLGWTIARRLTAPVGARTFDLTIRSVEHDDNGDLIVLDRTEQTTGHGIYNLWFEHGGCAQLSTDIIGRGPTRVARRITGLTSGSTPKAGDRTSWSGIYYAPPADAGLHARDITITTSGLTPLLMRGSTRGRGSSAGARQHVLTLLHSLTRLPVALEPSMRSR